MEGAKGKVGAGDFNDNMGYEMQCPNHPYRNNLGGICAFCLQEKLGKLVSSSSFPFPVVAASSSSSSSPSFRSDAASAATITAINNSTLFPLPPSKSKLSFLLAKKTKKKKPSFSMAEIALKQSKSTANRRFFVENDYVGGDFSPRRRGGFWSFLSSKSIRKGDPIKSSNDDILSAFPEENDVSPANSQSTAASLPAAFDRKVSRSRSVGCGSRSFSGDFFERISTGLGDCALRRVESQREGKPKTTQFQHQPPPTSAAHHHHQCMKERVKCAGIFGGFSSSSSSSSSSYWVPYSGDEKQPTAPHHLRNGQKSWNWAFASPMRAFTRPPATKFGKRETVIREASNKNSAPNLAAIPSLLAVGG